MCLPGSAWPGHRHHAVLTQLAGDFRHRLAGETGERDREAMHAFRRVRLR